eukprot:g2270.t1
MATLPMQGEEDAALLERLERLAKRDEENWRKGQASGTVYHGGAEHQRVIDRAFQLYSVSNPLHVDIWPSVAEFEKKICEMTGHLLGRRENTRTASVCGSVTSGGTESIFMSVKAHLTRFRKTNPGVTPEIVCCATKHAALSKACDVLSIRLVETPADPKTFKMVPEAVARAISHRTVMIFASAPSYAQGVIDPIEDLGRIAKANGIGLHVDCCLGGFFLPFVRDFRPEMPFFDFRVDGVSAISCDTHKYGYATKGTSVVLYRNDELRQCQYFAFPRWTGGLYVTPTMAGSRNGGVSAAAYASMMRVGFKGYVAITRSICAVVEKISEAARDPSTGLHVLGTPEAMIVAVASDAYSIYDWQKRMARRGYGWSSCQNPKCVHLCVTRVHVGRGEDIARAMREVSHELLKTTRVDKGTMDGPGVYGVVRSEGSKRRRKRSKKGKRDMDALLRNYMSGVLGGGVVEPSGRL